jgi:hypothetical protein
MPQLRGNEPILGLNRIGEEEGRRSTKLRKTSSSII